MYSAYGWIITKDVIENGAMNGVAGPSNIDPAMLEDLKAGKGRAFKMYDDDGELYYRGKIISKNGAGSEDDFGPLDDFGMPSAGATDIMYKNGKGAWESL